jgi:transposase
MDYIDARSLSPAAKEALRKRAVAAVLGGMKQCDVAKAFGVSAYIVSQWMKAYRQAGEQALNARKKGPAKGTGCCLTAAQAATVRKLIVDKCPEQLKLPFYLWTREAVQELIWRKCSVRVAIRTVGNYLRDWGFTVQKPVRRAYEQNAVAVQRWLDEEYPAIQQRAKAEKALIYWGDEMGLRSDDQVGRSYGLRGQTPVIPGTGQRFGCNMISAVTNQGHLCFQVFDGTFTVKVFLGFMRRLVKQAKRKVFLIIDGHPVHRAKLVQAWREQHTTEVEIIYLPGYSPELNPDEMLNQDVKATALRKRRPKNIRQLKADVRSYLFSTQKRPDVVRSYFEERHVQYAKAETEAA